MTRSVPTELDSILIFIEDEASETPKSSDPHSQYEQVVEKRYAIYRTYRTELSNRKNRNKHRSGAHVWSFRVLISIG